MIKDLNKNNNLLQGFNNGNIGVYELVFDVFYKKLCYFANTIVLNETVSEDIVQEVFVKLWQMKKDFESFDKVSAFLYVSVRNGSFNFIKSRDCNNESMNSFINISTESDTVDNIIRAEIISTIDQAIATLPAECQKIMNMILQGYSLVEIADVLKLAPSTVRAQKARGLKLLKPKLSDKMFLILLLLS